MLSEEHIKNSTTEKMIEAFNESQSKILKDIKEMVKDD